MDDNQKNLDPFTVLPRAIGYLLLDQIQHYAIPALRCGERGGIYLILEN